MLRIAVTGSHGVGKSYIVENIEKRAVGAGLSVEVVDSPTRYVKSLGVQNLQGFEIEWMCMSIRKMWQLDAEQVLRLSEEIDGRQCLLVADRCMLDEISYLKESLESQSEKPEGLAHFLAAAEEFAYQDVLSWDRVFYKPPHPDHQPVGDGVRPEDVEYQSRVARRMAKTHLLAVGAGMKGKTISADRDKALDQIWNYVREELGVQ